MASNKVKQDGEKLKGAVKNKGKNEKQNKEIGQQIDSGETVYFKCFTRVHVSQAFVKDAMFLAAPLLYDKPTIDRKTGEVIGKRKALGNFVISSDRTITRPSSQYFEDKGIIADFPETTLESRWSVGSIEAFHNGNIDVDPIDVFRKLKGTWQYFMDLAGNPGAYTFLPLLDTLSYCISLFEYAPYLKYEGEKGSSKSKGCQLHEFIDFNAFSGVDVTPAVMFRTLQDTSGSFVIDEAETFSKLANKSDYELSREAIINAGFKKNGKVSRMEKIDGKQTRIDFRVFGIKIIGGIHGVSETIRDRSYQILLRKTLNKEISKRTPHADDPVFQEIRDMLYVMILTHWKEIRDIIQNVEIENRLGLIGREWDKAYPLLVMAEFFKRYDPDNKENIMDDLWEFLADQKTREIALTIDTFDEVVINTVENAIKKKLKDDGKPETDESEIFIQLSPVAQEIAFEEGKAESNKFNIRNYSRSIRSKIEKLAIGKDFQHGTDNLTVFRTSLILIKESKQRHGITESANNKTNSINSINFINLINSINSFNSQLELIEINQKLDSINSINSLLSPENVDSLKGGINQLIELIEKYRSIRKNDQHMHSKEESDSTKTDVQNEKSRHDEKTESIEPITLAEAEEIKNTLLRSGLHLKATDTGISIGGERYNIAVPVSYYRQNSEMIDQAMSKWNLTKKNDGALGTVFFDIPLKKEVQP